MPIDTFHSDDELQNVLWGLSVLWISLEGLDHLTNEGLLDPEKYVAPLRLFVGDLMKLVERIQKATGGVLIECDGRGAVVPKKDWVAKPDPATPTSEVPGIIRTVGHPQGERPGSQRDGYAHPRPLGESEAVEGEIGGGTMAVIAFNREDEVENLMLGLALAEAAAEGMLAISDSSGVPEEMLEATAAFLGDLRDLAEKIQEATGGVVINDTRRGAYQAMQILTPERKPAGPTSQAPETSPGSGTSPASTTPKPKREAKSSLKRAA